MRTRVLLLLALSLLLLTGAASQLRAAEVLPSAPTRYFNDYALLVKPETAEKLNRQLEDCEKETSNQLLVVVYPKLETDSALEDFTNRTIRTWGVGQRDRHNGAVLFVFVQSRRMRIEVDRGLEGVLPDARCRQIIGDEIAPRFKTNDFDGGLSAGVTAMIAAVKGEYQGSGRTVYQQQNQGARRGDGGGLGPGFLVFIFLAIFLFIIFRSRSRSGPRGGMFSGGGFSPIFLPMGGGGSSWSSGGGGGSSGGGGGDDGGFFSGGGGSSSDGGAGGGGASGDW